MLVRFFDVADKQVIPSEQCYVIPWLKVIMDAYPVEYCKIYAYIQFMTCPDSSFNPYLNIVETDREEMIRKDIEGNFDMDDVLIQTAIENAKKLNQTPTYRVWLSAKNTLDKLAIFLETTTPTTGRDGSIGEIRNTLKQMPDLRRAYNDLYAELLEENNNRVRGGGDEAYDE